MSTSPTVTMVAAMDRNRIIGVDGKLPWDLPDDRISFRRLTLGKVLILGRKTYEAIGRLLPDRFHVILTRDRSYTVPGAHVAHSPEEALAIATEETAAVSGEEIIVAGGGEVYAAFLPRANRMYLTIVDGQFKGDARFPEFDTRDWVETNREHHPKDTRHASAFDILTYNRK